MARAGYKGIETDRMTAELNKALKNYRSAKCEEDQSKAEEALTEALLEWRKQQVAVAVKQCIRIATECHNRDISPADVILESFQEIL